MNLNVWDKKVPLVFLPNSKPPAVWAVIESSGLVTGLEAACGGKSGVLVTLVSYIVLALSQHFPEDCISMTLVSS